MFDILKEEVREKVPESVKRVVRSWYRNVTLHRPFFVFLGCILVCWLGWALFGKEFVNRWVDSTDKPFENAAQLGDSFGILNTLFAGIAALGATFAYLAQSRQLRDAEAIGHEMRIAAKKQQFESAFFQLLNVFHEIVGSIVYSGNEDGGHLMSEYVGRDAIRIIATKFQGVLKTALSDMSASEHYDAQSREEVISKSYEKFFSENSHYLSHYFRMLYRIFSFISESNMSDKLSYGKIVRAQLSDHELCFLFYNGFFDDGKNMNRFVNEFALLKHLPLRNGFPKTIDRSLYGDERSHAYCDSEDRERVK